MKKAVYFMAATAVLLALSSCSKEQGNGGGEGGNVLLVLNHNGDGLADVDVLGTLGHQNLRHIALRVNDKQRHHFLLGGEIERALIGGDLDVRAARRSQT